MSDQLNDFIAAQHQTNLHLTESMTRVETLLAENSRRLFGGDGQVGALPFIMQEVKQNAEKAEESCGKIEKRTRALETWKKNSRAYVAGVIAVLALEGSALAFYFNNVASHVKTVLGR
jgi:hypothetical protein